MAKLFGPLTRIATLPIPTAVALTGKLMPERCLLLRRIFCSFCPTATGTSVAMLIAYSPEGPSTLSRSRRIEP